MKRQISTHVDWKKIVIVASLIILTVFITATVTWYFVDDVRSREVSDYQERIEALETENKKLQEGLGVIEAEQGPENLESEPGSQEVELPGELNNQPVEIQE
jgi:hypothetical protein